MAAVRAAASAVRPFCAAAVIAASFFADSEASAAVARRVEGVESQDARLQLDRRRHDLRVAPPMGDQLLTSHEPVGVVALVGETRRSHRPVRAHELEPVPAVLPAAPERRAAVDDDVLAARL